MLDRQAGDKILRLEPQYFIATRRENEKHRLIARAFDYMSLSAPSHPGKLRSFTMQILS